jgi:hypothetical protein
VLCGWSLFGDLVSGAEGRKDEEAGVIYVYGIIPREEARECISIISGEYFGHLHQL